MISLGYLRLTERLTIVIIRARNLPQAEEAELDPGKWMIFINVERTNSQVWLANVCLTKNL